MRQTSTEAYEAIRASGCLGERTWQTYATLFKHGPMTQAECWQAIPLAQSVPQRSITPRFAQLLRKGFIRYLTDLDCKPIKRKCAVSGKLCMVWDVTDSAMPVEEAKQAVTRLQRASARIAALEKSLAKVTAERDALAAKVAKWGRPPNALRLAKALEQGQEPKLL
jgi:hypothetical protein